MRRITLLDDRRPRAGRLGRARQGAAFRRRSRSRTRSLPRGSRSGTGNTVYVGSVGTGAVWVGDLRTGAGRILVEGAPNVRSATGIELDHGRLWVSGARFGNALVYNARTGALITELQLATGAGATFINDAVATKKGVYFTDSQRPVHLQGRDEGNGRPGAVTTIPLGGEYQHVAGQFNLNGIVATENGKTLIAVQSVSRKLLTIDPKTGAAKTIDLGGYDLRTGTACSCTAGRCTSSRTATTRSPSSSSHAT